MCTSSYSIVARVVLEQILELLYSICFSFGGMSECVNFFILFLYVFFFFWFFVVMAGLAPEGSQFDGQQYDSKMNELCVPVLHALCYLKLLNSLAMYFFFSVI